MQLKVFGDPAPSIAWFRGNIALVDMNRFKFWTLDIRLLGIERLCGKLQVVQNISSRNA